MIDLKIRLALAVAAALSIISPHSSAEAARKCKPRIDAKGTGQGILGAGTMNAKVAAIDAFEAEAAKRYGSRYGEFDNAISANFDCKSGALKATCVVTAKPCR